MSGLIKIGYKNTSKESPIIISNFSIVDKQQTTIKLNIELLDKTISPSYKIYLNGNPYTDIIVDNNNIIVNNLKVNTEYSIYVKINDKVDSPSINFKTLDYEVYGICIDESNSNPETAVTYTDGAIGQTPAKGYNWGSWKTESPFNKVRQCGFKEGKVYKYIDPKDETKYIDGTPVGEDVDVMVEFPKIYWNCTIIPNGYELRMSDVKINDNFVCLAHTIGTREVDNVYIGSYLGSYASVNGKSVLRSIRRKKPQTKQKISYFRLISENNGTGYHLMTYYLWLMLQILYLIMYKNLNSQSALGKGYVVASSSEIHETGCLPTSGLLYGEQTGTQQVKFLGVEDLWGNAWCFLDGLYSNPSRILYISKQDVFNDTGSGYENLGVGSGGEVYGFMNKVKADNKRGFMVNGTNGSDSLCYCDYGAFCSDGLPYVGGHKTSGNQAGIFHNNINKKASEFDVNIGGRLCYLG